MRALLTTVAAAAGVLAGCAATDRGSEPRTPPPDPLYTLEMADGGEAVLGFTPPGEGERLVYQVDLRFAGPGGDSVQAPRITAYPAQRAHASVLDQVAYIRSFETEVRGGEWLCDPIVATLRDLSLVTTLTPGVRVASHLDEAFVQDYDLHPGEAPVLRGPIVGTLRTGLSATIEREGTLTLSWTTSPEWEVHETTLLGVPVRLDLPSCRTIRVAVPFTAGRRLVSLAHLSDGGTAAVLLDFEPEGEPAPGSARLPGAPSVTAVVRSE